MLKGVVHYKFPDSLLKNKSEMQARRCFENINTKMQFKKTFSSVVDTDPAFNLNADPDPECQTNADPWIQRDTSLLKDRNQVHF